MAIQTRGQHGMILPDGAIANQYQLQVLAREAGFGEGDVFGDRIILAVAFPGCKGGKRCAPAVGFAMLGIVAHIADGHIDRAIGLIQLIAAGLCLDGFDQPQKLRGMGWASLRVLLTTL